MNGFERKGCTAPGATTVANRPRNLNHARPRQLAAPPRLNTPSLSSSSSREVRKGECVRSPFGDSCFLGRSDLH